MNKFAQFVIHLDKFKTRRERLKGFLHFIQYLLILLYSSLKIESTKFSQKIVCFVCCLTAHQH